MVVDRCNLIVVFKPHWRFKGHFKVAAQSTLPPGKNDIHLACEGESGAFFVTVSAFSTPIAGFGKVGVLHKSSLLSIFFISDAVEISWRMT
ncbi:hypothetical protein SDC9_90127 [bioreactor metagenome]|uniref:Uncharacterized protein n=1 Tax=bioreactor metagenome TaxID=1076179 RepID=A0A644ZXU0_9ZZZZ